jgi:cell division protein FtsB
MDLQEINKTDYQEQGPKKGIVIIVITILLGTNGLLLWQFFDKKNSLDLANQTIVTTTAEKDALQMQLNQFKAEYEKLKSDNAGLQNQLSEKDEEIKAKVTEIQNLIRLGGPAQIARAKAELAKLKEMNDVYVAQIDSLNVINAKLQQENMNLSSNLSKEMSKVENLSAENSRLFSKVSAGSVLKAMNIVTDGLRYRSNGKEVITSKAKQVQRIRIHFTLGENQVVDKGPIDIYFRVLNPDGSVMSSDRSTFKVNGQDIIFTTKESVDYSNVETPVESLLARGQEFEKGKYIVEIYSGGSQIGSSEIELK